MNTGTILALSHPCEIEQGIIRDAVKADIPRIVEMGRTLADQSSYACIVEYDPESLAHSVSGYIKSDTAVVLVCEKDCRVVGVAVALVFPLYSNHDHITSQELFLWVDPEYRGYTGPLLMKALEGAVRDRGARSLTVTAQYSIRPEATGRLYRRAGFKPTDCTFMKRIF